MNRDHQNSLTFSLVQTLQKVPCNSNILMYFSETLQIIASRQQPYAVRELPLPQNFFVYMRFLLMIYLRLYNFNLLDYLGSVQNARVPQETYKLHQKYKKYLQEYYFLNELKNTIRIHEEMQPKEFMKNATHGIHDLGKNELTGTIRIIYVPILTSRRRQRLDNCEKYSHA